MDAFADIETMHMVLDLDIVIVVAGRISVSPCAVAMAPAGWLVVKLVLVCLLLKVWIKVSTTCEVEYKGVDAWFPSTSTTEYKALVVATSCSLRLKKSRGKEQDCNVSAKIRKGLRKYIRNRLKVAKDEVIQSYFEVGEVTDGREVKSKHSIYLSNGSKRCLAVKCKHKVAPVAVRYTLVLEARPSTHRKRLARRP